ncbi:SurA N-terminal domain-containing protein [Bradyrhizobium sp. LHD-71]|uniref:SurA N-terminal domain-containing protein n=1 Tax=Bradyrhizobium sp. LHD-71 TaxID=3072141 RepID=UPI0028107BE0|nr:SurA N-terminal domain-containing protein [Bradyrhizobium sp. LHD-71]MDQ8729886.1 SurA N-terminal domain-containing protein [Bradyrhizobium sp. LHD-71]
MKLSLLSRLSAAIVLAVCIGPLPMSAARAQNAVVVVNGDPITNFDIEQRVKLIMLSNGGKTPSRQDALEELINDRVKIKEGKKFSLEVSPSELETQYATMAVRMRLTADQLNKVLEGRGIRPETLKARIKADFIWSQLVRGRYGQSLIVGEKDIASAIEVKGDGKEQSGSFEYKMRPVVLFAQREGSQSIELRKKEAETLRGRVQGCDQAERLFRAMRDAVIRDQVVKTSADLPQVLRELLDKTPVGQMTPPEVTRQGVEMVVLCSRAPSTETPEKRAAREKLFAQKYETQAKKYLQEVRRSSMIEYR